MSDAASRKEKSKFQVIVHATKLRDELFKLSQRNFGVKSLDSIMRTQYGFKGDRETAYAKGRCLLRDFTDRIDQIAARLEHNIRAANSIYPRSISECEQRRSYQNDAIANCEQLIVELQRIVKIFNVDVNIYKEYIQAINREIGLIKDWRQSDNKFKMGIKG